LFGPYGVVQPATRGCVAIKPDFPFIIAVPLAMAGSTFERDHWDRHWRHKLYDPENLYDPEAI
jgi:hypothetical protein